MKTSAPVDKMLIKDEEVARYEESYYLLFA